jgi:hypothetical protein
MFETSNEGYDTYLRKRENIINRMNEVNAILDIEVEMTRDDYDFMVQVYAGEHLGEGLSEKDIARRLAEDQTYYMTKAQAKVAQEVMANYQQLIGTAASDIESVSLEDLLFGKEEAIQMKDKYWGLVDEYYHALRDSGLKSTEAQRVIATTIFGSEEI